MSWDVRKTKGGETILTKWWAGLFLEVFSVGHGQFWNFSVKVNGTEMVGAGGDSSFDSAKSAADRVAISFKNTGKRIGEK